MQVQFSLQQHEQPDGKQPVLAVYTHGGSMVMLQITEPPHPNTPEAPDHISTYYLPPTLARAIASAMMGAAAEIR